MHTQSRSMLLRLMTLVVAALILIGSSSVFAAQPHKETAAQAQQSQTSCETGEVLMDWEALPWPLVGGDGPLTSPQAFTNVGGSDVDITFSWVNTYQQPYLYDTDAPIAEMSDDVRIPNHDAAGSFSTFTITFDPPVYINQFTVGSLSVLNDSRFEYVFLSALDNGSNIQPADSVGTSTYVVESGTLQSILVPGRAIVDPSANVYRLRGTSDQPPGFLPGYDRVTLEYTTTPIEEIEMVIFGSGDGDADTAQSSVDLAPISTTVEAFCFTDPGTLDVSLSSATSSAAQNNRPGLIAATILLAIASAYVWWKRPVID